MRRYNCLVIEHEVLTLKRKQSRCKTSIRLRICGIAVDPDSDFTAKRFVVETPLLLCNTQPSTSAVTVGIHCYENVNRGHCWNTPLEQPQIALLQQWHLMSLWPLISLLNFFSCFPWWRQCPRSVKTTFGISMFSRQYIFPVLLFMH
jgi:hypothetical protein